MSISFALKKETGLTNCTSVRKARSWELKQVNNEAKSHLEKFLINFSDLFVCMPCHLIVAGFFLDIELALALFELEGLSEVHLSHKLIICQLLRGSLF